MPKKIFNLILFILLVAFVSSCNSNKTPEEMEELWSKANTSGAIIKRSGTVFNSATNKETAMRDARTRLQTGGGLFGKEPGFGMFEGKKSTDVATVGMPINPYLWKGSLDTINFMSLASADPFGGIIITDWYINKSEDNKRCKLNIFIRGVELKTNNLKVSSFCQEYQDNKWINLSNDSLSNTQLENAILNKAKKLKLSQG